MKPTRCKRCKQPLGEDRCGLRCPDCYTIERKLKMAEASAKAATKAQKP